MSSATTMSGSTGTPLTNRFEAVADKAKEATANVGDKAKELAANVADKASQAASTLGDKASQVASTLGDRASQAVSAIGDMASDAGCAASHAACDVGHKADDLTASAGAGIKGFGDRLSHNAPHTGMMGTASQAVARSVHDGGQYIEDAKLSGMVEDVTQLIRRNPIPAVCVAIGLGWLAASKMRS